MMESDRGKQLKQDAWDALFIAWSDDCAAAAPRPLTEWLARYPEAEADLIAWAADELEGFMRG